MASRVDAKFYLFGSLLSWICGCERWYWGLARMGVWAYSCRVFRPGFSPWYFWSRQWIRSTSLKMASIETIHEKLLAVEEKIDEAHAKSSTRSSMRRASSWARSLRRLRLGCGWVDGARR